MRAARAPVIAGLGMTKLGKVYGRTAMQFAAEAVTRAVADAGLRMSDVDGLLTSSGVSDKVTVELQRDLALEDLRLVSEVNAHGATQAAMVQMAAMAVLAGMAEVVACVFADAPLRADRGAAAAYGSAGWGAPVGWMGLIGASGLGAANAMYALAARRYMDRYATTSEQLGAVAVAQREWALRNPAAQMQTPITLEDHQSSRMIADPLRLLDCTIVSNGGIAVVVTTAERAASLAQTPVHIRGWGQSHPGRFLRRNEDYGHVTGAAKSGAAALAVAGLTVDDVDVAEIYDPYTYVVLLTLEDYGLCARGEAGPLAAEGGLGPDGWLKVNTGGGMLSSYYMWGMTPVAEAVIQARGQGGERQVANHDVIMVSGSGGILDQHSTLILSPHSG